MASQWEPVTRKSKEVSRWRESRPLEGGEWSGSGRPSVEVERAIATQDWSDKLSRAAVQQSRAAAVLQDLRFGRRDGRGRGGRDQLGSEKMGWTVNKLSGLVGGSCRVVSWSCRWSTVLEDFWYRSLGPTVLAVTGTVGWQVKGRGAGEKGC